MVLIYNPVLIGIAETWIKTSTTDYEDEYNIPGYQFFHLERKDKQGGGVGIYVDTFYQPIFKGSYGEDISCVSIRKNNSEILILAVYRPPHRCTQDDESLYSAMTQMIRDKTCIIIGDLNCRNINWDNREGDAEGERLLGFAADNFLQQKVREPTRGNNILDLVFTSDGDLVQNARTREHLASSDHLIVEFEVSIGASRNPGKDERYDYRRTNWHEFRRTFGECDLVDGHVTANWSHLKNNIFNCIKRHVPIAKGKSDNRQPKWLNNEIKKAISDRNKSHKIYKVQPSNDKLKIYQKLRRSVKKLVRTSKREEEIRIARTAKVNPKEFYAYINNKKSARRDIGPLNKEDGDLAFTDSEMSDVLNKYFCTVFTLENTTDLPTAPLTYSGENKLTDIYVTTQIVEQKICKLNKYKSQGPDKIPARIIKELAKELATPLVVLFNQSLRTSHIPDDWKKANVTPIFKKGKTDDPANYRPISLTSIIGKLLESIVADYIVDHLNENNLLIDTQHGFRRHRSCLTNLLEFFDFIIREYDINRAVDVVYLDFQKAFDKVPHKRLMLKIRALGIEGKVADWVEEWLKERKQRVVIKGAESEWRRVTSGVPQGSVLGPILFLIYVNDIDIGLVSKISKFADDIKLGSRVICEKDVASLQKDLDALPDWSDKWQMRFNLDKCKVMHIGVNNPKSPYTFFNQFLTISTCEKDLGVYICDSLKVSMQCLEAEKKALKVLGFIKRSFNYKNQEIIITLYKSLVRPHLEYAVQMWSPYLRKDIERLERVQARATKLIPSLRNISYERRLKELNMFSLETRRKRGELIETFKIIQGFENIDSNKLFSFNTNITRSNGYKIHLPVARTEIYRNFFTYKVINAWNNLSEEIVNSPSVNVFKNRIDKLLLQEI